MCVNKKSVTLFFYGLFQQEKFTQRAKSYMWSKSYHKVERRERAVLQGHKRFIKDPLASATEQNSLAHYNKTGTRFWLYYILALTSQKWIQFSPIFLKNIIFSEARKGTHVMFQERREL